MRCLTTVRLIMCTTAVACASPGGSSANTRPDAEPSGQIIPTTYRGDRFFATLPLVRGDTVSFFLDTGGGTLLWEPYLPYLELASSQDTVTFANGTKAAVAPFPKLREGASLPPILGSGPQGDRLVVRTRRDDLAFVGCHAAGERRSTCGTRGHAYRWLAV